MMCSLEKSARRAMCCTFVTIPGGPHVQTAAVPGPILSAASTCLRNMSSARGPLQDMALDNTPMHHDLGPVVQVPEPGREGAVFRQLDDRPAPKSRGRLRGKDNVCLRAFSVSSLLLIEVASDLHALRAYDSSSAPAKNIYPVPCAQPSTRQAPGFPSTPPCRVAVGRAGPNPTVWF